MNAIGCFSEMNVFEDNGSIYEYLCDEVNYNKKIVSNYLRGNKKQAICFRRAIDCISGEQISSGFTVRSDGEYVWCDFLAYYVEHYNIKLPSEFVKKVYSSIEKTEAR